MRDSSPHPHPGDGDSPPAGDGPEETARLGPQRWRVSCQQPAVWPLLTSGLGPQKTREPGEGQSDDPCLLRGAHCAILHAHSCALHSPLPYLAFPRIRAASSSCPRCALHNGKGASHMACDVSGTPGAGQQWPCSQQPGSEPGPFCSWWRKLMLRDSQ